MSNRPNYVLKLADGTERVFTPSQPGTWSMRQSTRLFSENELSTLGATPVPQPKPKMVWQLVKFWIQGDSPDWANNHKMGFASIEDAENYRRRCESIGPEWTDWEPKEGDRVWSSIPVCGLDYHCFNLGHALDRVFKDIGVIQPTKERRDEWLDRFGKAWGLK